MQLPRNWEGGEGGSGEPVTDSHCTGGGGGGLLASMINGVVEWRVGLPFIRGSVRAPPSFQSPRRGINIRGT